MISYFSAGTGWAVQTGNLAGVSIDDARKDRRGPEGHRAGGRHRSAVGLQSAGKPGDQHPAVRSAVEATTAVVSGKADAVMVDSPVVAYAIQQSATRARR